VHTDKTARNSQVPVFQQLFAWFVMICIFRPVVWTGAWTCHLTISQILNKSTKSSKNQNKPTQLPVTTTFLKMQYCWNSGTCDVRTEGLKWQVRKVDITSGCLTIMVYFCNNEWVFILTKVQLYCVFVFGNYEVSNTFLLLHGAYILISGMKFGKFDRQFSSFLCFHIGIFWK